MPNWCHNTLTVSGDRGEVERFVTAARPSKEAARAAYEEERQSLLRDLERVQSDLADAEGAARERLLARERYADSRLRLTFARFRAELVEAQPLTFTSLVPQPSEEEYAAMDEANQVGCDLCGGTGRRPRTEAEALLAGARWKPSFAEVMADVPADSPCNACTGRGRRTPVGWEAWYVWRLENWGCKWDASFGGPFMAVQAAGADVEASVDANGVQDASAAGVVVYRFDTPWAPPIPFVTAASERFPQLEFELRFGEPGGGFAGRARFVAGVAIEEAELEVEEVLAPEEMWF